MKKIIISLGVALVAIASCTKFVEDTPVTFSDVAAPEVTSSEIKDSSFVATVTPKEGTTYYTYLVTKGAAKSLDAETLLTLGYKSDAVKVKVADEFGVVTEVPLSGSSNKEKEPTVTLEAYDLLPNTVYTVYAVATNSQGKVSAVTATEVTTTDSTLPLLVTDKYGVPTVDDSALAEGALTFSYNDPVKLTEAFKAGEAVIRASYMAVNAAAPDAQGNYICPSLVDEVIPVDSVSVDGNDVTVKLVSRIPGSFVLLGVDAGVVENELKAVNAESKNGVVYLDPNNKYAPATTGIGARFETEEWEFYLPLDDKGERWASDTTVYFSDYTKAAMTFVADTLAAPTVNLAVMPVSKSVAVEITYHEGDGRKVINQSSYFAVAGNVLNVGFEEEPKYGSNVSVSIAAGDFEDLWGNPNAAYTNLDEEEGVYGNWFYSYGYTLADITGTYNCATVSAYASYGEQYNEKFTMYIKESDDAEKGNVILSNYCNWGTDVDIYATFDPDGGTLFIKDWQLLNEAENVYFAVNGESVYIGVPAAGTLSGISEIFGYYYDGDNPGWGNAFTSFAAARTSLETEPEAATVQTVAKARRVFNK